MPYFWFCLPLGDLKSRPGVTKTIIELRKKSIPETIRYVLPPPSRRKPLPFSPNGSPFERNPPKRLMGFAQISEIAIYSNAQK